MMKKMTAFIPLSLVIFSVFELMQGYEDNCPQPTCDSAGSCHCNYTANSADCAHLRGTGTDAICSRCCEGFYYDLGDCFACGVCESGNGDIKECKADGKGKPCPNSTATPMTPTDKCLKNNPACAEMRVKCNGENCSCVGNTGNYDPPCTNLRGTLNHYSCSQCTKGYYMDMECVRCGPCTPDHGTVDECVSDGNENKCPLVENPTDKRENFAWIAAPVLIGVVILAGLGYCVYKKRGRHSGRSQLQGHSYDIINGQVPGHHRHDQEEQLGDKNGITDVRAIAIEKDDPNLDENAPGADYGNGQYSNGNAFHA